MLLTLEITMKNRNSSPAILPPLTCRKMVLALFSLCIVVIMTACATQKSRSTDNQAAPSATVLNDLPELHFCVTPDPKTPSSAFEIFRSQPQGRSGYWVRYQCRQTCDDWRNCLVPAYTDDGGTLIPNGRHPEIPKQALAYVVDGMGGHLAMSSDGGKTVLIHTGAGGTRYYDQPADTLERQSKARTVMVRWEKGYTSSFSMPPFPAPVAWGWYSRTSEKATNIRELNKRVASLIAWTHDQLAGSASFGTLGCSMGTNATFGPVLWHGLDPIIDYQLFVGGPNMWDLNAQCGRRHYTQGYCAMDGVTPCTGDEDCTALGGSTRCVRPDQYTTIDKLFEDLPNHIHVTDACDIRNSNEFTEPYPPFDDSSMGFTTPANWEVHHRVDFLINVDARQGASFEEGIGGDEYWGLGHFPYIYRNIKPAGNKHWRAYPGTHHCAAMFDEALDVIKEQMDL